MDFDPAEIAYVPTTGVRRLHETPLAIATDHSLEGYGCLVDDPESFPIEIVRCKAGAPSMRTRAIRAASRKESSSSGGKALYARNNAVADSYLFAWSTWPEEAATDGPAKPRRQALVWRANYHPDGGQLFCPLHGERFVVPLAMPGDDVRPERSVTFWCDGSRGLYIHPNVWHGAIVPLDDHAELLDRQGRVHARVSVDFAKEFGCYLAVPMHRPVA